MATGDLKNNIRKLQAVLKAVQYEKDLDINSVSKGISSAYLPIYHYALVDYSRHVATQISELNIELYGKSDLRFMEAVYKVLRELFSFKPPITKDQFFSNGFVERKIIMCNEIVQMVREKHQHYAPKAVKSKLLAGTRSRNKLGPRPESAPSLANGKSNTPGGSLVVGSHGPATINVSSRERKLISKVPVHESMEITKEVPNVTCESQAGLSSYDPSVYGDSNSALGREIPNVQVVKETTFPPTCPVNAHLESGSGVKCDVNSIAFDDASLPIDIIALAPENNNNRQNVSASQTNVIETVIHDLVSKIRSLENRLTTIEHTLSVVQETTQTPAVQDIGSCNLTHAQLSTILARITLLESYASGTTAKHNKPEQSTLSLENTRYCEASTCAHHTSRQNVGLAAQNTTEATPKDNTSTRSPPDRPKELSDISAVTNVINRSTSPVVEQTHRIAKMLYDTEDLLQIKVDTPSRLLRVPPQPNA